MSEKIPGRNDPCPCGSGKKFKQCCITNKGGIKRKISAVWVNKTATEGVNLMDRTFGNSISDAQKKSTPSFLTPPTEYEEKPIEEKPVE